MAREELLTHQVIQQWTEALLPSARNILIVLWHNVTRSSLLQPYWHWGVRTNVHKPSLLKALWHWEYREQRLSSPASWRPCDTESIANKGWQAQPPEDLVTLRVLWKKIDNDRLPSAILMTLRGFWRKSSLLQSRWHRRLWTEVAKSSFLQSCWQRQDCKHNLISLAFSSPGYIERIVN